MASAKIPLTDLPAALRARGVPVTYARAWRAAVDGVIPADRDGGRWFILAADLPRIVQSLGAR